MRVTLLESRCWILPPANLVFLVSGVEKATILREVLKGDGPPDRYPARAIHLTDGRLQWLLDRDAASRRGDG